MRPLVTPEIYAETLRYVSSSLAFFFLYHAIMAGINMHRYKVEGAVWNLTMCLSTSFYCAILFVSTLGWSAPVGDGFLMTAYVLGFFSYFSYIKTIKTFLQIQGTLIKVVQGLLGVHMAFHCWALLALILGWDPMVIEGQTLNSPTVFQMVLGLSHGTSNLGYLVGALGVAGISLGSVTVLRSLYARQEKEWLLLFGVFLTLLTGLNDTFLAMGWLGTMLPLYYLGNSFEAIRFVSFFQEEALRKVVDLERKQEEVEKELESGRTTQILLRVLSHDINNSVTLVKGFIQKAMAKQSFDYLAKANRAADRIVTISKDVRKIESSRSGKLKIECEPVSLLKAKDEMEFLFRDRLEEKNLTLRCRVEDRSILAQETNFIHEVLGNLLSNAIKFSPKGGTIELNAFSNGEGWVRVEVVDHGIGMPQDILSKVFDFSAPTSRKGTAGESGTGFGLPLVASFVEGMGAGIHVESVEGKGTKFSLTFPEAQTLSKAA